MVPKIKILESFAKTGAKVCLTNSHLHLAQKQMPSGKSVLQTGQVSISALFLYRFYIPDKTLVHYLLDACRALMFGQEPINKRGTTEHLKLPTLIFDKQSQNSKSDTLTN
jgi:hypothetical protein